MSYSEQYFPPNHFDIQDPHHDHPSVKKFKDELYTIQEDDELELPQEVLDELKIINKTQQNIICIKACSKNLLKTILIVIMICFFLGVGVDLAYEKHQILNRRQKLIKEYERNYMVYNCEEGDLGVEVDKLCSNLKQSIENEQNRTINFFDMDAMNQMKEKVLQAMMNSSAYSVFAFCALLIIK